MQFLLKKYCTVVLLILSAALYIFPKIDIYVSHLFYKADLGFVYKNYEIALIVFRLVPIITTLFAVFCFIYLGYLKYHKKTILSHPALYLLFAAVIGPGLLVNCGLKEHFGRARPCQILEFGGNKAFTGPLRITNECEHNCSFSSGHAAMGYYFSSISYVVPKPYQGITFLCGIIFGSIIGLGRVVQGAHFLSDVIFSGLFTICTNHLCFLLWRKIPAKRKSKRR